MLRDLRAVLLSSESDNNSKNDISAVSPPMGNLGAIQADSRTIRLTPKKRRETVSTSSPHSSPSKPSQASGIMKRKFSLAAPPPPRPNNYSLALDTLDTKYGIWWECAELLIELGGRKVGTDVGVELDFGTLSDDNEDEPNLAGPRKTIGIGLVLGQGKRNRMRRQRAVTLGSGSEAAAKAGESHQDSDRVSPPLASPPRPAQWRATTGRATGTRDLTARQLILLRGMLEADEGKEWDPRSVDGDEGGGGEKREKKVRARGFRDLWRGFKGGKAAPSSSANEASTSDASAGGKPGRGSMSYDSSASESATSPIAVGVPGSRPQAQGFKPPRTPSPSKRTLTPSESAVLSRRKQPLRRPSLAGIFGIAQKGPASSTATVEDKRNRSSSDRERVDGAINNNTLDPESVSSPRPSPNASSTSSNLFRIRSKKSGGTLRLHAPPPPLQPLPSPAAVDVFSPPPMTAPLSRSPPFVVQRGSMMPLTGRLSLSPENIRPLLKHTREISGHLNECIGEVREMMGGVGFI